VKLVVVDDSAAFRAHVVAQLAATMPEARVTLWDPLTQGRPTVGFDWTRYDCLLLDEQPGPGADGLAWLQELKAESAIPPTIILSDQGGDETAVRAVKAGASDYLRKADLSAVKLAMAIKEALLEARAPARNVDSMYFTQPIDLDAIGRPSVDNLNVPGYRALRRIGEGGMSKVYLAERLDDGFQLVLKVLDPRLRRDENFKARFMREYRIIQRIHDENVVTIFDQGFTTDGQPFLAMEYFPGGDLQQRIRQGITSMTALKILMQIARALDAVHTAGVVHRDLKPQNIMFRENNRLAILDFGLARELDATSTLTQKGMVMATPLYMSPEQCLGQPHDPRGDLYATGVILYEMLTGETVYTGENASTLAFQHVHGAIPHLPKRLAGYQSLLDRLLAKRPEERFQSARELFAYVAH
jgi:tRNA A-37 threonylcarbamoyl transferase component Bud32/ActR/RegA family two-component response regulator